MPRGALRLSFFFVKSTFLGVALLSAVVNVLYLTGSFFMLEIYDRVIPSRSMQTLVGLCVVAALLYAFQGLLDAVRGRVLVRIGSALDAQLGPRVFAAVAKLPLKGQTGGDGLLPLRDLDVIRGFVSGSGPQAFCDLPWIPLYVAICWAFHPYIGLAALGGALLLCCLALFSEMRTSAHAKEGAAAASARMAQADGARRNAEVVQALGMSRRLVERWEERNDAYREAQQKAADVTRDLGGLSKIARMALQSGVLWNGHSAAVAEGVERPQITVRRLAIDLSLENTGCGLF